ncbi:MAG: hypothetical protein R2838_06755 [Caldilineaceae bacterium]
MHILYLDDSGSPANPNEDYFVLGGLSIPEASVRWLTHQLNELAELPGDLHHSRIEFHAAEVFSGRKPPWSKLHHWRGKTEKKESRIQVLKDVLGVLDKAKPDIVAFGTAVHKASYPDADPIHMAFEDVSSRFNRHLRNISTADPVGIIVIDKSAVDKSPESCPSVPGRRQSWGDVAPRVRSPAVCRFQLAFGPIGGPHCLAIFRFYNAGDANYLNCLEGRFQEKDGILHGLAHLKNGTNSCLCPACVSRRR